MAISLFTMTCVENPSHAATRIGIISDIGIGIAVTVIGVLGMYGIIPGLSSYTNYMIGAGAVYGGLPLLLLISQCKRSSQACGDVYLCKDNSNTDVFME